MFLRFIRVVAGVNAVGPLYLWVGHLWIQPTTDWKYSEKKIPECSKKHNLNFLHTDNYLHSIYIVFTTIYIAFTVY